MKLVFLTIALLAVAFVLLGVKVLFVKGAKFPSGHAHDIPNLNNKVHHSVKYSHEKN